MKNVTISHPFSAQAIGLGFDDMLTSHSKPHQIALLYLKQQGFKVNMSYLYYGWLPKKILSNGLNKWFWPVTYPKFSKKNKWRNEFSWVQKLFTYFNPSELTIFNMSGLLSNYTIKLANELSKRNKPYIAMIGGVNVGKEKTHLNYYKNAHHIIVHTKKQKQDLEKFEGFEQLDIRVIPLGIDTSIFKPKLKPKSIVEFNLLFVGRVSRLKQIELTVEALDFCLKKGLNCQLDIIGPKSDLEYYNELLNKIKLLQLEPFIKFKGAINHNKLVSHYQKASLLLMPSKHESFGMVAVEAMACGTPVVAIKESGGPEEIISHSTDGIVTTILNYSESVFNVLNSPKDLNTLSKNCRETVLKNYSSDVTSQLFFKSVNDAIDK